MSLTPSSPNCSSLSLLQFSNLVIYNFSCSGQKPWNRPDSSFFLLKQKPVFLSVCLLMGYLEFSSQINLHAFMCSIKEKISPFLCSSFGHEGWELSKQNLLLFFYRETFYLVPQFLRWLEQKRQLLLWSWGNLIIYSSNLINRKPSDKFSCVSLYVRTIQLYIFP